MIAAGELEIQRDLTRSFIAADSLSLALTRTPKVSDGAGGLKNGTPATLTAQTLRLNPLQDAVQSRTTADGKQVLPQYMLMGEYNADLDRGDTFTVDGRRYEVVFVLQNKQYQVKAEVYYRGE
jgi:hypothetical protein